MLKNLMILAFVLVSGFIIAQEDAFYFGDEQYLITDTTKSSYKSPFFHKDSKFDVRFNTGAMYSSIYGNGLFSSYAAPEVGYKFDDKFRMSVGAMATVSYLPSFLPASESSTSLHNNRTVSYYMFAKGEYMVNDKLRLRAASLFDANPMNNGKRNSINSFGFDYKVGNNSFFSAEVNIVNINPENPLFHNPLNNQFDNYHIRPFGGSMFSEPFPSW